MTSTASRGSFAAMYEVSRAASHDVTPRQARLDQLEPNPDQPRTVFHAETLEELAASIRAHGVLQPLLVRPHPSGLPNRYQLVAGERRFQAARLAGLDSVPVVVKALDDAKAREIALIENVQREDISPLEEAQALEFILKETGLSHRELGERLGKTKAYIEQRVRLLGYPEDVRQALESAPDRPARLSPGHAKAIVQVDDAVLRGGLIALVGEQQLSVREAERRAHQLRDLSTAGLSAEQTRRTALEVLQPAGLDPQAYQAAIAPTRGEGRPGKPSAKPVAAVDLRELAVFKAIEQARATGQWSLDGDVLQKLLRQDLASISGAVASPS